MIIIFRKNYYNNCDNDCNNVIIMAGDIMENQCNKLTNAFLKAIWQECDSDNSLTPAVVFAALEQTKQHFKSTMEMLPLKTYSELTQYYYNTDCRTMDEQKQRTRLWRQLKAKLF